MPASEASQSFQMNATTTYPKGPAEETAGTIAMTTSKGPLTHVTTKHSDSSEDATFTLQVKRPNQSPVTGGSLLQSCSQYLSPVAQFIMDLLEVYIERRDMEYF